MRAGAWGIAACVLAIACGSEPTDWTPVMEETSMVFLRDQVDKSLAALADLQARIQTSTDPATREDVARLETALLHLRHYYLPMVEAREAAYNAYRLYHLKRLTEAQGQLARARQVLEQVAMRGDSTLADEMAQLVDQAMLVEESLKLRPKSALPQFKQLIASLNLKALKGDLILNRQTVH